MTVMMKKCRTFACDHAVGPLRLALGYRTCGRHGRETLGEPNYGAASAERRGAADPKVARDFIVPPLTEGSDGQTNPVECANAGHLRAA